MTLPIKLESIHKSGTSQIAIVDRGVITIGRSKDNAISVDSTSVSRNHGEFICTGSHWVYRDLGSTNGSSINHVRMQPGHIKLLKDRDMLSFSNFHIGVSYLSQMPSEIPNSIVVFYKDRFFSEYIPRSNADTLCAGGSDSEIIIEGEDNTLVQFAIQFQNDAFSMQLFQISTPVLVNGEAVNGYTQLYDIDEILVGDYVIIINSQRCARAVAPSKKDDVQLESEPGSETLYNFNENSNAVKKSAADLILDTTVTTKVSRENVSAVLENIMATTASGAPTASVVPADSVVAPATDNKELASNIEGNNAPAPYPDAAVEKRKSFGGNIEPVEKRAPLERAEPWKRALSGRKEGSDKENLSKKQGNRRSGALILLAGVVFLVLMLGVLAFLVFSGDI